MAACKCCGREDGHERGCLSAWLDGKAKLLRDLKVKAARAGLIERPERKMDGIKCPGCGEEYGHATDYPTRRAAMPWGRKPDPKQQEMGKALRSALLKRVEEMWLFRDALGDFERKFLADMKERVKVPGFFPSEKQAQVLDRIKENLDRVWRLLRGEKEPKGQTASPFMPEGETRRRLRIGEED